MVYAMHINIHKIPLRNRLVVIDGPFRTDNGVQTGVQAMTSCVAINLRVTMIYELPKKRNIFVILEITFSNLR